MLDSPSDEGADAESPGPDQPYGGARATWVAQGIEPLNDASAVAGVAVVQGKENKEVVLYGVEPATGKRQWRRLVTPPYSPPSEFLVKVTTIDDRLVAFVDRESAGSSSWQGRLVLLDPRGTGTEVAASEPMVFASLPWECGGGKAACIELANDQGVLRLGADGKVSNVSPRPGADWIWRGIWHTRGTIIKTPGQSVKDVRDNPLWEVEKSAVFPRSTAPYSIKAHGDPEEHGVVILSGKHQGLRLDRTWEPLNAIYPASEMHTLVGLSEKDGSVLWQRPGVAPPLSTGRKDADIYAIEITSGLASFQGKDSTYKDIETDFVRIDPQTGKDMWRVKLGKTKDDILLPSHSLEGDRGVHFTTQEGQIFVSMPDGKRSTPEDKQTNTEKEGSWEWEGVPFEPELTWKHANGEVVKKRNPPARTYSLNDKEAPVKLPIPTHIGAHFDDVVVVGTVKGLIGYRQKK